MNVSCLFADEPILTSPSEKATFSERASISKDSATVASSSSSAPQIRVEIDGFNVEEKYIVALCSSAGRELWQYFPDFQLPPLVLQHSDDVPMAVFRSDENDEQIILLATSGTFWCQYSYQFSHELAHILAGLKEGSLENQWFEETICETASLFVLRRMASGWKTSPPFPNWAEYRDYLRDYADVTMKNYPYTNEIYRLGTAAFYQKYAKKLSETSCDRALNGSIAIVLLHYFEKSPEHWEAIQWLNVKRTDEPIPFNIYLKNWYQSVPERHKEFVLEIARLFGVVR